MFSFEIYDQTQKYTQYIHAILFFRESLFRQLCALNWILDAMSQDVFPPVVVPITNCWNIKYVF